MPCQVIGAERKSQPGRLLAKARLGDRSPARMFCTCWIQSCHWCHAANKTASGSRSTTAHLDLRPPYLLSVQTAMRTGALAVIRQLRSPAGGPLLDQLREACPDLGDLEQLPWGFLGHSVGADLVFLLARDFMSEYGNVACGVAAVNPTGRLVIEQLASEKALFFPCYVAARTSKLTPQFSACLSLSRDAAVQHLWMCLELHADSLLAAARTPANPSARAMTSFLHRSWEGNGTSGCHRGGGGFGYCCMGPNHVPQHCRTAP